MSNDETMQALEKGFAVKALKDLIEKIDERILTSKKEISILKLGDTVENILKNHDKGKNIYPFDLLAAISGFNKQEAEERIKFLENIKKEAERRINEAINA